MKRVFLLIFLLLFLTNCATAGITQISPEETQEMNDTIGQYKKISAEEAKNRMSDEDVIVLDVRTPEEYEDQHIEGALLIPDYDIERLAPEKLPNKDATILIYCRTGNRSAVSTKTLLNMGYTNVYDFGGINSWEYGTISE